MRVDPRMRVLLVKMVKLIDGGSYQRSLTRIFLLVLKASVLARFHTLDSHIWLVYRCVSVLTVMATPQSSTQSSPALPCLLSVSQQGVKRALPQPPAEGAGSA